MAFGERPSGKLSSLVVKSGDRGALVAGPNGHIYYALPYPYEIREYTPEGRLVRTLRRKVPYFRPPRQEKWTVHPLSGCRALAVLPDGTALVLIWGEKEGQWLDVWRPDGSFGGSFRIDELGLSQIRRMTSDTRGHLFVDRWDPPAVLEYEVRFEERQ